MRVLVTGASGLVGTALVASLQRRGDEVTRLVRRKDEVGPDAVWWDPPAGQVDTARLPAVEAAVHLSGEPIAEGRWTSEKKKRILNSRRDTTGVLASTLAHLNPKPRVLVSLSAVGYYGNRGEEVLDENSTPGTGFLAGVCRQWEESTGAANAAGIRVVIGRMGVVLSANGGALSKMLPPFRLGLGGPLGSGDQYISWIAEVDAVNGILFLLATPSLAGPVNLVAPNPVTNREFAKELGAAVHRPSAISVPALAVRLAAGEMANEALLASQRVVPARLQKAGFKFVFPALREALSQILR
jgi:uncharacterized protein